MVCQVQVVPQVRVVRCQIGDERYALELGQVSRFQRADQLRRDPGADGRLGFVAAKSGDVPIYALADLLGRPRSATRTLPHLIVMETEQGPWGLMVDQVSQVVALEEEATRALPRLLRRLPAVPAERIVLRDRELFLLLQPERLHPRALATPRELANVSESDEARFSRPTIRGRMMLFATSDPAPGERRLTFGLNLSAVEEIIELPPLAPVPRTPPFLRGLAVWRSRPVPVVDLGLAFGLAPSSVDRHSRLLLVHAGNDLGWLGLLTRPDLRVISLPIPHLPCQRTLPIDLTHARVAVELPGQTVVVPNLVSLLVSGL